MDENEFIEGIKEFNKVYIKEELRGGIFFKAILTYSLCLVVLVSLYFLLPGMKQLFFVLIGLLLIMACIIIATIFISYLVSLKKNSGISVIKVDYDFKSEITINHSLNDGSLTTKTFAYKDVKKVIETESYFYLFLNDALAIPVRKNDSFDREFFIKMMYDKNIFVKEFKI
jgi:hypothetical protein